MKRYTEESLIFPIQDILSLTDGYMTTTQIIEKLEKKLELSKADTKIVRGNTTRFHRTVHNSVSHRSFHTSEDGKRLVSISPTSERINVMRLTSNGRKMVQRKNRELIYARYSED